MTKAETFPIFQGKPLSFSIKLCYNDLAAEKAAVLTYKKHGCASVFKEDTNFEEKVSWTVGIRAASGRVSADCSFAQRRARRL